MKASSAYNFNGEKQIIIGAVAILKPILKDETSPGQYMMVQSQRDIRENAVFYKAFLKIIFPAILSICIGFQAFAQRDPRVDIVTMATPPVNPFISQYVSSPGVISTFTPNVQQQTWAYGQITCISPTPFSITTDTMYQSNNQVTLFNMPLMLNSAQKLAAFGNFSVKNLMISGIDPSLITDATGVVNKLPDGNYSICFTARNSDHQLVPGTVFVCGNFTIACGVLLNTIVRPPANPIIANYISTGNISSSIQIKNPSQCNTQVQVKLFGKIECTSPAPFTIGLNPQYNLQPTITVNAGMALQLNSKDLLPAFGNFIENNLVTSGIDLTTIKDANNSISLPSGNYRICFYARYVTANGALGDNASDPNIGCGMFTVCNQAGGAPQFTQPVNNLDINSQISVVQPASPVIFTWIPPQSTCGLPPGGYTYDFEIRELLANQNVNDAINNPYVFRKTGLPSATFLLDTNLNKNVLQEGKRYAIRVRAVSAAINLPVAIDNNGYSRIEAFQYGGHVMTQNGIPHEPEDYYIPFKERLSDLWDNIYTRYKNHSRGDTLVPIKEYIAFALTQNGTAYSVDAIELFLALNPELADVKKVKISYAPQIPVFPAVPVKDQNDFDREYETNLEPDNLEVNKFLKYLDTLNNYKQKIPDNAVKMIHDLASYLNNIKTQVDSIDRVSVNLINKELSELLYELHLYSNGLNNNQFSQMQSLVSVVKELTSGSLNSTAFFYLSSSKKATSLSSYQSNKNEHAKKFPFVNDSLEISYELQERLLLASMKQLLPFDVIVYRSATVAPFKPVLDAPDLSKTYRIYYTLSNLYNHKNPEATAKSATHLASTVQVSLPSNTTFTFWTLNMLNHKNTKPGDIDLRGVSLRANKQLPDLKRPSIVIKVD